MDGSSLFSLQRRERIMAELGAHGAIRVTEFARLLGISEMTVRRDINHLAQQGLVSRVHGGATIRSPMDRSVPVSAKLGRYTIGMVVPSLDYYWPHVVYGARAEAVESQSRIALRGSSYDIKDDRRQIQALVDSASTHALIVAPNAFGRAGQDMLRWLESLPIPVVLAERQVPSDLVVRNLESVGTDHPYGASLAVHHLHATGHRRLALFYPPASPTSVGVMRGWRDTIERLGMPAGVVAEYDDTLAGTERDEMYDGLIDQCLDAQVTAVLILADPSAVAFVQRCLDRGVRVPHDLAVVAYDDEVAYLGSPAISAVRPPKQYVGRMAVRLALARLTEGAERPLHHVRLEPQLQVRDSSRGRVAVDA
ncbi:LacI family DNA-binding transcriptional regulator [Leifsonia sp. NPDC058230]|uniref:LacI family DNA-binding transcriptional regulator n=1 Tax=Leifsonia sp. NPDC058230 TaxID=3346391 RepID=UPI0036DBF86A